MLEIFAVFFTFNGFLNSMMHVVLRLELLVKGLSSLHL
jgi:hypothetical protein